MREGVLRDEQTGHRRSHRLAFEQHRADAAHQAGRIGKEPADVEGGRHRHGAGEIDAPVRRAQSVDAAIGRRHAHRSAGVAAEREITGIRRGGGGRAARRAARNAAGRPHVHRRAVVRADAGAAVEEFVADRLARDGRAGGEDLFHRGRVHARRLLRRQPLRTAAAGARAGDVVEVLDHRGETRKRPARAARDRRLDVVRHEEGGVCFAVHFWCSVIASEAKQSLFTCA